MRVERADCLIINEPSWFEREDFLAFLNSAQATTWHQKGGEATEMSDLFVTYDHGDSNDFQEGGEFSSSA